MTMSAESREQFSHPQAVGSSSDRPPHRERHKWTHKTFFLRIIFAERDELGVKQRSVPGQLCLTELHCASWLQLPQPQQLEFLTVS